MASKRHKRRRSCESKVRHPDKEEARRHANYLGDEYMPYPCSFCHGWHVGRANRAKRQRLGVIARNVGEYR